MSFVSRFAPVGALALLMTAGLAGCGGDVESSQVFQEQVARIDRIDEDLKASKSRLIALDSEFQQVSKDVATLVANGGATGAGNPEAVKAIEARMQNIEKSMQVLSGNFTGLSKQVANSPGARLAADIETHAAHKAPADVDTADATEADVAANNAPDAAVSESGDNAVKDLPKAPQIKARRTSSEKSARKATATRHKAQPAAEREAAPKSRGVYYLVKNGDTLEAIASRFDSSAAKIRAANGLPSSSSRLMAGQEIYVPGN